jgi:hypothetical protein
MEIISPDAIAEFFETAELNGWFAWVRGPDELLYWLPSTTMIGTFATMIEADDAFDVVRKHAKDASQVLRSFIVLWDTGVVDSDIAEPSTFQQ